MRRAAPRDISVTVNRYPLVRIHPEGNPGANRKSISHICHPILVAFVWELTQDTIYVPLGCLQGSVHQISREQAPYKVNSYGREMTFRSFEIFPLSKYLKISFIHVN